MTVELKTMIINSMMMMVLVIVMMMMMMVVAYFSLTPKKMSKTSKFVGVIAVDNGLHL